jgi:hypothetical protein
MTGPTGDGVLPATVRWNPRVRLVLSDVDETIAGLHEPASAEMLSALSRYLGEGGKLFLVTGAGLQRVTSGITDGIRPALREGVLVAPASGAEVWGFTGRGTVRRVSHNGHELTAAMSRRWRAVVAQLIGEFALRAHDMRPPARFHVEVGRDSRDVMLADRGAQISLEFVNEPELRVAVHARAVELLRAASLPVTAGLASVFALNMTIEGVSKASAVARVLGSAATLASIGLTAADVAPPHALEVWGDDFSGADLEMSRALAPSVRSIDFRAAAPPNDVNVVAWDGEHRLQAGLLEYLKSRDG